MAKLSKEYKNLRDSITKFIRKVALRMYDLQSRTEYDKIVKYLQQITKSDIELVQTYDPNFKYIPPAQTVTGGRLPYWGNIANYIHLDLKRRVEAFKRDPYWYK